MSPGLVYHAGGLGDFVLSLPAIQRTVQALDADRWHYWGPADRLALLPGFLPAPPEVLRFGHTLWGDRPEPSALSFLRGCSAVLAFGGREAPAWASRLPGAAVLPVSSFPPPGGLRVPLHQARQLDVLGVPRVRLPWLAPWRRKVLPDDDGPAEIVLHPGSGDPRKNVPALAWREALRALRDETGARARIVLGPAEGERGGWDELRGDGVGVTSCETLPELLGVLAGTRLFLANDSGAAHLAGLLGIPTVVAYGPSNPALWRPLGPRVRVVGTGSPCAPCTSGERIECSRALCVEGVEPAEIVRQARAALGR